MSLVYTSIGAFSGALDPFDLDLGIPEVFEAADSWSEVLVGTSPSIAEGGELLVHPTARIAHARKLTIGSGSRLIVCEGAQLTDCYFVIDEDCLVIIGPGVRFTNARIHCEDSATVLVGARSTWETCTVLGYPDTLVATGMDCMFSNDVAMRTSDGHGIFDLKTKVQINARSNIVIGNHVWLGNGCRVNKGSTIGSGTVVAQKAVVSGNLDSQSIYGGVPARKIRDGIGWSRDEHFENIPAEHRKQTLFRVIRGGKKRKKS